MNNRTAKNARLRLCFTEVGENEHSLVQSKHTLKLHVCTLRRCLYLLPSFVSPFSSLLLLPVSLPKLSIFLFSSLYF